MIAVVKRRVKRKRTELIGFYVTKEEKDKIVANAEDNDQTVSDYCRKTLVRKKEEGHEHV